MPCFHGSVLGVAIGARDSAGAGCVTRGAVVAALGLLQVDDFGVSTDGLRLGVTDGLRLGLTEEEPRLLKADGRSFLTVIAGVC